MLLSQEIRDHCPDCGVSIGERHIPGCDVERCPQCGLQRIGCGCTHVTFPDITWNGYWPGSLECDEYSLYSKLTNKGWEVCSRDDPGAVEDLNTLYQRGQWNPELQRWIMKNNDPRRVNTSC